MRRPLANALRKPSPCVFDHPSPNASIGAQICKQCLALRCKLIKHLCMQLFVCCICYVNQYCNSIRQIAKYSFGCYYIFVQHTDRCRHNKLLRIKLLHYTLTPSSRRRWAARTASCRDGRRRRPKPTPKPMRTRRQPKRTKPRPTQRCCHRRRDAAPAG